jgi:hypothetical protein
MTDRMMHAIIDAVAENLAETVKKCVGDLGDDARGVLGIILIAQANCDPHEWEIVDNSGVVLEVIASVLIGGFETEIVPIEPMIVDHRELGIDSQGKPGK